MRPAPALFTLLGAGAIFLLGCGGDQNQLATGVDGPRPSFQQDCSLWPEGCPDDPVPPPGPGYHIGSATTPALCFSKTGVNISDTDLDGMDDGCEERLASLFRPSMTTAPASYDCDPQIEPYWAVKYFPSASNLVRIAYLLAYHRDCGDRSLGSGLLSKLATLFTLNGTINNVTQAFGFEISTDDPGDSHSGDSEWVMVNIRYDATTTRWYLVSVKFSAHYGTVADGTKEWPAKNIEIPAGSVSGGFPRVWVAMKKHANYVSRASCNAGRGPLGAAHDNCDPSVPDSYRLAFNYLRNIGSMQANKINVGSCVNSEQPIFYPATECFWKKQSFDGWLDIAYGHPASPYYGSLVMEFECRAYTINPSSNRTRTCLDFGVNRAW